MRLLTVVAAAAAFVAVTVVIFHAEAAHLGPDGAEPAVVLDVWGGTIKRAICTFNAERIPDSSDGDTCEMIAQPDLTDTVGMIVKMRIVKPARVSAVASVYDSGDATDPNPRNDGR